MFPNKLRFTMHVLQEGLHAAVEGSVGREMCSWIKVIGKL